MSDGLNIDNEIRGILGGTRTIAVVGASANAARPSYGVMRFLIERGYIVHPVNPGYAGRSILDRRVYGSLAEVPAPIDMVDVFRNAEAAGLVADEVIALVGEKSIRTLWLQLGVVNDAAAARARSAGLVVIMDRCPKIEYARLNVNGS